MYYAKLGVALKNYHATTHPSQPNYWSLVAGEYFMHTPDNYNHDWDAPHLGDLLDAKGISWKTYQEGYPGDCFVGNVTGRYARKHNPFISFTSVHNNLTRCTRHVVNAAELDNDLNANSLPQFSFYTPDMDNDGHDSNVSFAGQFLRTFLDARLHKFPAHSLIVISWDEDHYDQENKILTTLLSTSDEIPGNSEDITSYNHYSLLRMVEDNWNLGTLGKNDSLAKPFDERNFRSIQGPSHLPLTPPVLPKAAAPIGGMIAGFLIAFLITLSASVVFMYRAELRQWINRLRGKGFERVGLTGADGDGFEEEGMHDVTINLDDDDSLEQ
jgi:hypothetical protein